MLRHLLTLFVLLGWSLAGEASPGATPSLAEMVSHAETILSGTVDRTWVEMDRRVHVPVVRVVLKDIRAVKGTRKDRLLISFWAREVDTLPHLGKLPEFRRGARFIILSSEPLDAVWAGYTPVMSLNAGLFPVLYDSLRRQSLVHDWTGRPVARIERDRLVVVDVTPSASRTINPSVSPSGGAFSMGPQVKVLTVAEDPRTRVSEGDFLRVVRELLAGKRGEDDLRNQ